MFTYNSIYFGFCLLPLTLLSGRVWLHLLYSPPSGVEKHWWRSPWAFSSPGWTVPALLASSCMTDAPTPYSSLWPSAECAPVCARLSCTGELIQPRTDTAMYQYSPRMLFLFFAARIHCCLVFNFTAWTMRQLSASLYCHMGLLLPRDKTLHFFFLTFMKFLSVDFSSSSWSLWIAAMPSVCLPLPPHWCHKQTAESASVPSSRPSMDILNRMGPSNRSLRVTTS